MGFVPVPTAAVEASAPVRRLAAMLLLAAAMFVARPARAETFTVYAAASLTETLERIAADWGRAHGHEVRLSLGASAMLAKQIDAGAPAAIFIAADLRSMDFLDKAGRLVPGSRRNLLGNSLVLVMSSATAREVALVKGFDLATLLGDSRLAIGDPAYVPAGQYAEQALRALAVWEVATPRLALTDSVRSALALVGRGEAPAGIVYATDARVVKDLRIAGTFPTESHAPIVYPLALLTQFASPAARDFHAHLLGEDAARVFTAHGFIRLQ
jgi:molybdate transport system substrate-binding protein